MVSILFLLALLATVHCLENGLGRTPPMGYNTWYDLECGGSMNETTIRAVVDAFQSLNLASYGYEYINLDDCWAGGRYSNGTVYPDSSFSSLPSLIEYVHMAGLKFGIYTDRGNLTCAGRPGSLGYEQNDANTYASWGVDFIKEDSCYATQDHEVAFQEYAAMRDAISKTGRPIYFALCGWYDWYAPVGHTLGNDWRIGPDDSNWPSILTDINTDANLAAYAGPGGWNNPCLLLGNNAANQPLITELQSRAQFSMWSILAAPLLLSQNIRNLSSYLYETYTNIEVIKVDQDPLGKQGVRIYGESLDPSSSNVANLTNIWVRPLLDGSWASVFINVGPTSQVITCDVSCFGYMGFFGKAQVAARDLWLHKTVWTSLKNESLSYESTVAPNGGVQMLRFYLL